MRELPFMAEEAPPPATVPDVAPEPTPIRSPVSVRLMLGDCLERIGEVEDGSIDAIVTDPPYPEIKRPYGRMTETEWDAMMRRLIPECRRVLKPKGSAVFVLQPNSRKIGSMRPWLWEFMAWTCREWNMVQDAWWWNYKAMPEAHSIQGRLMRPSLKACVWLGPPDCFRDQDAVLWTESDDVRARRLSERASGREGRRLTFPSGQGRNTLSVFDAAERRGGVSPFNVMPADHGRSQDSAGAHGHPAGTPITLADWWIRYISPPDGVILDPFIGSGTMGLAAIERGRSIVGIERSPEYMAIAERRLSEAFHG